VNFVAENSKKLQKIGFGRKNQLSSQCVHIAEFRKFQKFNVKNKECVHTWANGTGYISKSYKP
jgi:hypothetical protein